jgi:hypothetical protein
MDVTLYQLEATRRLLPSAADIEEAAEAGPPKRAAWSGRPPRLGRHRG